MSDEAELSPYLRRLAIGERPTLGDLAHDELFPFEGEIQVKPLEQPHLPEPRRLGEPGADPCPNCGELEAYAIWSNERWILRTLSADPHALPMVLMLIPRAHHDLEGLPATLAGELGFMLRRVSRAISTLPDVGRVHFDRRGDSSEHFHVWFLARPLGMWQMRGPLLALWDEMLTKMPATEWRANLARVATAMAAEDGDALI
jgi:diadenosine tetraphosphate (Ap4A) HIT family hydrolase